MLAHTHSHTLTPHSHTYSLTHRHTLTHTYTHTHTHSHTHTYSHTHTHTRTHTHTHTHTPTHSDVLDIFIINVLSNSLAVLLLAEMMSSSEDVLADERLQRGTRCENMTLLAQCWVLQRVCWTGRFKDIFNQEMIKIVIFGQFCTKTAPVSHR